MGSLAMAFDILANDNASPTFLKVGQSAEKLSKTVEQAAQAMQKAANAEVEAAGKVRVAQSRLDDIRKSGKANATTLARAEEQLASAQRLEVRAQGDAVRAAGDHEKALKHLSDETSRASRAGAVFGKSFAGGIRGGIGLAVGALAVVKGFADIHEFVASSIAEARESQQVGAKSTAIIKATGGAAKISATQLGNLTTAISNKTGVDDEAIQSGSNLLLTFKQIRNEAGAGNDVFNRATAAAVDLSKAGFGSIEGASKQLGKALNDPVKGISALNKAGVTFTDSQKKQIAALVKSGDVLSAQKIILGEVEHQVGGVAAASTTAGEKLKVAWDNAKEAIGTAFLPALDKAENGLRGELIPLITDELVPALPRIARGAEDALGIVVSLGKVGGAALRPFVKALDGGKDSTGDFVDFLDSHQGDITSFFVEGGHAALQLGIAISKGASTGLKAYAGLASGMNKAGNEIMAEEARIVDNFANLQEGLGFDGAAAKSRAAANSIRNDIAANQASDPGKFARDLAATLDSKLTPALEAADKGLVDMGKREVGSARQRDQASKVAQAIDSIGTNADGSQVKLKKFSDISKLSASAQKGLRDRISSARDALKDQLSAAENAGNGQKKLTKTWQQGKDRLYDEFRQMGLSKKAAGDLADKYAGIKPKVKTTFTTPGLSQAKSDATSLKNTLNDMPKNIKIKIAQSIATKGDHLLKNSDKNVSATGGVWTGSRIIKAASGRVLPGYSPGADIHKFYSATAGELDLSGYESIMVPAFTRAVGGVAGVNRLNRAAEAGLLGSAGGQRCAAGGSWIPKTVIQPGRALAATQQPAQGVEQIVAALKQNAASAPRGPLVHVDRIDSGVDLELYARQAEFRERQGSFS